MKNMYMRAKDFEAVELDQEWVILDSDTYTVTKLNEVGGVCWSLLKNEQTVDTLVSEIVNQYDVSKEMAEVDVEAFINQLLQKGLVRYAS